MKRRAQRGQLIINIRVKGWTFFAWAKTWFWLRRIEVKVAGLRGFETALPDFGKIQPTWLGFAILRLPPRNQKPGFAIASLPYDGPLIKNTFFFFTKSAKMIGLRSSEAAPPGFHGYLRGFCIETPKPSAAPQALFSVNRVGRGWVSWFWNCLALLLFWASTC